MERVTLSPAKDSTFGSTGIKPGTSGERRGERSGEDGEGEGKVIIKAQSLCSYS